MCLPTSEMQSRLEINVVYTDPMGRLAVADIAVKSHKIQMVTVYVPNCTVERHSFFFQQLTLYLISPEQIVLIDDWNMILETKIDKNRG